jgi:diguanylate cyclase
MLFKALQQAQTKSNELQQQIDDLHANRQLDALTGLYNRSVMSQTVDMWVNNDTKNIAALAINLDHFKQFNDNYGMTIGNVILSKVAQKVKSYVSDSGLPVRLAGEEFLVLIPDANPVTAKEIAEKVRVGVEKLQFINAKNKERLPKITVSIGVTEYCEKIGLDGTIQKATSALRMAKATGRNRVYTD